MPSTDTFREASPLLISSGLFILLQVLIQIDHHSSPCIGFGSCVSSVCPAGLFQPFQTSWWPCNKRPHPEVLALSGSVGAWASQSAAPLATWTVDSHSLLTVLELGSQFCPELGAPEQIRFVCCGTRPALLKTLCLLIFIPLEGWMLLLFVILSLRLIRPRQTWGLIIKVHLNQAHLSRH